MIYRESLPEACPPSEAIEIVDEQVVFRLVATNPPTADDFLSQRARRPSAIFPPGSSECLSRGLSVHTERKDSEKLWLLPLFKKRTLLCQVRLRTGAGRIQQTFQPSHHTWWPLAAFDILAECEIQSS